MIGKNLAIAAVLVCLVQAGAALAERNACEVLTKKDVFTVQGEVFTDTKLSEANEGALEITQCFYRLPTFSKSVSVTVIRGGAGAVSAYWKSHFESGREEQEARRVDGVGRDAVWSGNRMAGALYVLGRDTVLRISVGGAGSQEQKIAKSKRLATRALPRL